MKGMEENKNQTPNRLRDLRERLRLSQKQVALRIGHNDATLLSRYEHGRSIPPLTTAMKLSALFQTPVHKIFPELADAVTSQILGSTFCVRSLRKNTFLAEEEA